MTEWKLLLEMQKTGWDFIIGPYGKKYVCRLNKYVKGRNGLEELTEVVSSFGDIDEAIRDAVAKAKAKDSE